jgi:uncharacterized protein YdbL (DUF1318 family)
MQFEKAKKSYASRKPRVGKRSASSGRFEMTELERRILCSKSLHINPLLENSAHIGIARHAQTAYGVSGRPPTGVSAKPTTSLVAPSALGASLKTSNSIQLNWTNNCTTASGYYVLRSTDGSAFSRAASIGSSTANSYVDAARVSGHTYDYEVQAYAGTKTSGVSNIAEVTLAQAAPSAPAGLTASPVGSWVNLAWTDTDPSATGYLVLRSTDAANYTQIANLNSGAAASDIDAAVSAGLGYYYEIEAYNSSGLISSPSNVVSIIAPSAQASGGVSIGVRFSNELIITASGANDSISVTETGSTLNITADGLTSSCPAPLAGLFIYARGGSDGISIDQSVTVNTTLVAIDGASTAINSAGAHINAWIDSTDNFTGTGAVHRVSSFAGGVSKALGASLANPTDAGATTKVNLSLFGTGPVASDVNQGNVGDCYFVSSLAAFAGVKPSVLVGSAVDMGDGTYTVQFMSAGTPKFVRVSNAFSTGPFGGYMYAHPGANNTIWAMVMEKAFCYFRTGANTYASIANGSMGEAYSDLGVSSSSFRPGGYTDSSFYSMMLNDLTLGEAVTLGTYNPAPNLVSSHAYTLVSVFTDSSGVTHYVVRNPWGSSGDSLEDGRGYATLTFAQIVANFTVGYQAIG